MVGPGILFQRAMKKFILIIPMGGQSPYGKLAMESWGSWVLTIDEKISL
jgi:hypothetical protein